MRSFALWLLCTSVGISEQFVHTSLGRYHRGAGQGSSPDRPVTVLTVAAHDTQEVLTVTADSFAAEILTADPAAIIRAASTDPVGVACLAEDLLRLAAKVDPEAAPAYRRARAIVARHGSGRPSCLAAVRMEAAA